MNGYVFPNETEVLWSILIVLYPYITGLVAGAFIVSALYHVFGRKQLMPVARLALNTALAFLLVAPMPLLLHLGQPLRAFNIMWTPNPTSAMAGFGYIYSLYMVIVLLEIWFVNRKEIVQLAKNSKGISRVGYSILSLGNYDVSAASLHDDERFSKSLATIGIPAAIFLHGYVGFIFGAIKANPWWSTPLQPVIFIMSAIVSGTALLTLIYGFATKIRRERIDVRCVMSLNRYLWYFLAVDVALEGLEVIAKMYEAKDEWGSIATLLTQYIPGSFFGLQLTLGALVPLILLVAARSRKRGDGAKSGLTMFSAALVVVGVFAMRWNVVIGGQLVSKSLNGFTEYIPSLVSRESVLTAAVILVLPFIILSIVNRILSPWEKSLAQEEKIERRNVRVSNL